MKINKKQSAKINIEPGARPSVEVEVVEKNHKEKVDRKNAITNQKREKGRPTHVIFCSKETENRFAEYSKGR